jgi:ABC-2 type transport system permease protein
VSPVQRASRRALSITPAGDRHAAPLTRLLRVELRTEPRRPRTLVSLVVLALVPVVIGLGVSASATDPGGDRPGAGLGLITAVSGNGMMLPITALGVALRLLLPLCVCIAAADALAGEAAHGTLRGLLLAPVSRIRLVWIKAFGVLVVAVLQVAVVTGVGLLAGLIIVGGGDQLLTLSGSSVGLGAALARVALAAGWTVLQVAAVGAVALAVSAFTDHPLVVLATVVGGAIVSWLLGAIPALDWLRPVLLTSGWASLSDMLRDPVPSDGLTQSALLAGVYLVIGMTGAIVGTLRREA